MAVSIVQTPWVVQEIDSLSILQKTGLSSGQIPKNEKEELKNLFSKILNDPVQAPFLRAQKGGLKFDFDIDEERGFLLRLGGEKVGRSIAPFADLVDGIGPSGKIYQQIKKIQEIASIEELGKKIKLPPSEREEIHNFVSRLEHRERDLYFKEVVNPILKFFEPWNTGTDLNSIARNTLRAILCAPLSAPAAATLTAIVGGSQLIAGIAAIGSGGAIFARGVAGGMRAVDREDYEGLISNAFFAAFGASYASVGLGFFFDALDILKHTATPIWAAAVPVATVAVIVMAATLLVHASIGVAVTQNFAQNLSRRLDPEREPNEAKRLKGVLKWIEAQVNLSEFEILEIQMKTPSLLKAKKKMAKKLEGKWDQFERRTNEKCGKRVRENLKNILRGLENNEPRAIQDAKVLTGEIIEANYKTGMAHRISRAIAIIMLIAGILSICFLGPAALVPILFAIGAVLWLTVDNSKINRFVSEVAWKRRQADHLAKRPNPLPPVLK